MPPPIPRPFLPLACIRKMHKPSPSHSRRAPAAPQLSPAVLLSAYKSGVLPLSPAMAQRVVAAYCKGASGPPGEGVGRRICEEFGIEPGELTSLTFVLLRSSLRVGVARHMLATCSHMGDAAATVELQRQLGRGGTGGGRAEMEGVMKRLNRAASGAGGHGGAGFRMGEVAAEKGSLAEAAGWFRVAGERGVGEGWVRYGRIMLGVGKLDEAREAFEKGKESDNPNAYYQLAMLDPPSPLQEKYLLKAAASGVIEAAHNLAVYNHQHTSPPDLPMAKEWYTLAATQGFALSQVNLATILKNEGKTAEATQWLIKAESSPGEVGKCAKELKREMEGGRSRRANLDQTIP